MKLLSFERIRLASRDLQEVAIIRLVQGADRQQPSLLPECLDDYGAEDNPFRGVDVFVDERDLKALGFEGMTPAVTGRPACHPAMLVKLYVYVT